MDRAAWQWYSLACGISLSQLRIDGVLNTAMICRPLRASPTFAHYSVGLYLKCFEDRPDEMVSIGLTIETSIGPKCFARVDWRGTNHPNTHHLCGDLQFIDAGQTHFHNPALCPPGDDPMAHIRENLPIAVAIEARPPNFEALLDRCASILNVTNLTKATPPQWQSRILYP